MRQREDHVHIGNVQQFLFTISEPLVTRVGPTLSAMAVEVQGGSLIQDTAETTGARWFRQDELPYLDLSIDRTTESQLETIFRFASDPGLPTVCD